MKKDIIKQTSLGIVPDIDEEPRTLSERFIVPPFSIFDARQGYWRSRKDEWLSLGIQSEVGRGETTVPGSPGDTGEGRESGTYEGEHAWLGRKEGLTWGDSEQMRHPTLNYYRELEKEKKEKTLGAIPPNQATILSSNYKKIPRGVQGSGMNEQLVGKRPPKGYARAFSTDIMRGEAPEYKRANPPAEDGTLIIDQYRRGDLLDDEKETSVSVTGTSIFDPVLCELMYSWFCPEGGLILDPFAGGSVRGIVARYLGRRYIGIDLRPEQVEANEMQRITIFRDIANPEALTPVQQKGRYLFKRDDLFEMAGVRGGKVRTCWHLAQDAVGLTTAGSRQSPQVNIVANIASYLGIPCIVHTPKGELSAEVAMARTKGATVVQHDAGYNNVIIRRAKDSAEQLGWTYIPFGMDCQEAIEQTRRQVANIPKDVKRIVIPVGSGMSLAGLLWGMLDNGIDAPVLGVRVGANPEDRLNTYAPPNWRDMVTLVDAGVDYHKEVKGELENIKLDPIYEAKCLPFLEEGDLLWIVGIRQTEVDSPLRWIVGDSRNTLELVHEEVDFVFSCPPYYDLEVYSDEPRDLSCIATYDEFIVDYRDIIRQAISLLKPNRFACFVVGDVRDKKGFYRNFVSDTISAFRDVGALLYNEGILVTAVGSLPVRVGKQFSAYRKLGKTHQNVLVFYKGDVKAIKKEFCEVEVL